MCFFLCGRAGHPAVVLAFPGVWLSFGAAAPCGRRPLRPNQPGNAPGYLPATPAAFE